MKLYLPRFRLEPNSKFFAGFSCNMFTTAVGFHAEKIANQKMSKKWVEVKGWRTSGEPGLYAVGGGFTAPKPPYTSNGRYAAPVEGAYFCSVQLRLDGSSRKSGYFRLNLVLNSGKDPNNGFHAIDANGLSTNFRSMGVAGTIYLRKKDNISPWMYSSDDSSYTAHSESGWGCHLMGSRVGFHADFTETVTFGVGWHRLMKWQTSTKVNKELYQLAGGVDKTGFYFAPQAGYYFCATQIRMDSATKDSIFRIIIGIDAQTTANNGLHAIGGNGESTNYRSMRVAGTIYLQQRQKVSVHVYSQTDKSFRIQTESGRHRISRQYTCTHMHTHTHLCTLFAAWAPLAASNVNEMKNSCNVCRRFQLSYVR